MIYEGFIIGIYLQSFIYFHKSRKFFSSDVNFLSQLVFFCLKSNLSVKYINSSECSIKITDCLLAGLCYIEKTKLVKSEEGDYQWLKIAIKN